MVCDFFLDGTPARRLRLSRLPPRGFLFRRDQNRADLKNLRFFHNQVRGTSIRRITTA
jgi:hypothetical protein